MIGRSDLPGGEPRKASQRRTRPFLGRVLIIGHYRCFLRLPAVTCIKISAMNRRVFLSLVGGLLLPQLSRASPAQMPLRRLCLINAHTGETFDGPFRDDTGPIPQAMADLSEFLRDYHSGEKIAFDVGVLDFLANIMEAVGVRRATILSGYRTRETNAMLARSTFGVAEHSQHISGRALDLRLATRNEDAIRVARQLKLGGVGWSPRSEFFHIDTGAVRNWTLDEKGLDSLLARRNWVELKDKRQPVSSQRNRTFLPGLEHSGRPLAKLANSGRPLPGMETSGQPLLWLKDNR